MGDDDNALEPATVGSGWGGESESMTVLISFARPQLRTYELAVAITACRALSIFCLWRGTEIATVDLNIDFFSRHCGLS